MSHSFLCIETSTLNCSVAVFKDEVCLALVEESSDKYIHGELLHVFIQRALEEAKVKASDLSAVVVTKGPGSYTGLRIGVSAAKGLCYALSIPLYSLESLEVLAQAQKPNCGENDCILSLIDARRMEVYSAMYSPSIEKIGTTQAEVVEDGTFEDRVPSGKLILVGDAQEKLKAVLTSDSYVFTDTQFPSARDMGELALKKINAGQHEDVAYFEPFYLKDFVAGTPRKSPLAQ